MTAPIPSAMIPARAAGHAHAPGAAHEHADLDEGHAGGDEGAGPGEGDDGGAVGGQEDDDLHDQGGHPRDDAAQGGSRPEQRLGADRDHRQQHEVEQGQEQMARQSGFGGQARQGGHGGGQDEADDGDQEVVAAPAAGRREDTGGGSRRWKGWGAGVLGMGCTHGREPSRMRAAIRPLRRLRFGDDPDPAARPGTGVRRPFRKRPPSGGGAP